MPKDMPSKKYIADLFSNPQRWAFVAQTGFLSDKSLQIIQSLSDSNNIILDRSLYEDIHVFAKYFHQRGDFDEREYETYQELTNHFLSVIPKPNLILHCECSIATAKQRIEIRNRDYQKNYPENHIEDIYSLYDKWLSDCKEAPVYRINTEKHDVRESKTINEIVDEIIFILNKPQSIQLDMFGDTVIGKEIKFLEPIHSIDMYDPQSKIAIKPNRYKKDIPYPLNPWAYIAAPFTGIANNTDNQENKLFNISAIHGKIGRGVYRNMLNGMERNLKRYNIASLIPHRDINKWGDKTLTAKQAMESCTASVQDCDLFIGILGKSHGAHYEYGVALGSNKPSVIIKCEEIGVSFIGSGIENQNDLILVLECKAIKDIPSLFHKTEFNDFLVKNNLL